MAITTQKGAPAANDVVQGKFALVRFVRCDATAATPVSWTEVTGIQSFNIEKTNWGYTKKAFQFGGGDEAYEKKSDPTWSGSITFLNGEGYSQLAAMQGLTWTTAGSVAIPAYRENDDPEFILEVIARQDDNLTHMYSHVVPDVIIDDFPMSQVLEDSEWTLDFHTRRFPFILCSGAEMVYDVFPGTGSTTSFTLTSTPLTLNTATNYKYLNYDAMYYVKEQVTGATAGTLMRSGYSNTNETVTATTAPASQAKVQILYAKTTPLI